MVESPLGIVGTMLGCDIVLSKFELQSRYYIHFQTHTFWKGINFPTLTAMSEVVLLLLFYMDEFGIK